MPLSQGSDEERALELSEQQLREEVEVGDQSGLEHDGDVGGIEELDGVVLFVGLDVLVFDGDVDSESLEVDDDQENEDGGKKAVDVGISRSVEGLLEGRDLVGSGDQKVEQSNDSTFIFSSLFGLDGHGGEGLPEDVFADVDSNEEGDTGSNTISLAHNFIKHKNDDTSKSQLNDNHDSVTSTNLINITVHTRPDISESFTTSNNKTQQLLSSFKEGFLSLVLLVDFKKLSTSKQLHNHTSSNDGGDTEFHKGSSVGGKNDSHPIEGITTSSLGDTIEWHLTADEVDEEDDTGPDGSGLEGNELLLGFFDLRQQ